VYDYYEINPIKLLGYKKDGFTQEAIMETKQIKAVIKIENLKAQVEGQEILKGIDLTINKGEIHVIMGPNGAGKSTLANVLMGHPAYVVTDGAVTFTGKNNQPMDLLEMKVDARAKAGLFLSFQYPQEVPGVTVENFLRTAKKEIGGIMPMMTSSPLTLRALASTCDQRPPGVLRPRKAGVRVVSSLRISDSVTDRTLAEIFKVSA